MFRDLTQLKYLMWLSLTPWEVGVFLGCPVNSAGRNQSIPAFYAYFIEDGLLKIEPNLASFLLGAERMCRSAWSSTNPQGSAFRRLLTPERHRMTQPSIQVVSNWQQRRTLKARFSQSCGKSIIAHIRCYGPFRNDDRRSRELRD